MCAHVKSTGPSVKLPGEIEKGHLKRNLAAGKLDVSSALLERIREVRGALRAFGLLFAGAATSHQPPPAANDDASGHANDNHDDTHHHAGGGRAASAALEVIAARAGVRREAGQAPRVGDLELQPRGGVAPSFFFQYSPRADLEKGTESARESRTPVVAN